MNNALSAASDTAAVKIFAVLVLYKRLPAESPSLKSLLEASRTASSIPHLLHVLIVDNTPGGQHPGELPEGVSYRAAPENPGLAKAYNDALEQAAQRGDTWLLTLDQDTALPSDFLIRLIRHVSLLERQSQVAALVPKIADRGRLISPFRYVGGFLPRVLPPETKGILGRFASALNSASLFRVSSLQQVGGYDLRFPLHNSDTRLYQKLDDAGLRVAVAHDIVVNHELAILDRAERTTVERYQQMLEDECEFWDRHMGVFGRMERLGRLVGRLCKGTLQGEPTAFREVCLREILRRVFTSRSERMRAGTSK